MQQNYAYRHDTLWLIYVLAYTTTRNRSPTQPPSSISHDHVRPVSNMTKSTSELSYLTNNEDARTHAANLLILISQMTIIAGFFLSLSFVIQTIVQRALEGKWWYAVCMSPHSLSFLEPVFFTLKEPSVSRCRIFVCFYRRLGVS